MIHAIVHAADIQDRDGGAFVMATLFGMYPFLMKLYADGGYQGPLFRRAVAKIMAQVNIEIVKRSDHAKGFVVLPKRWVVERTFAWPILGGPQPALLERSLFEAVQNKLTEQWLHRNRSKHKTRRACRPRPTST